MAVDEEAFGAVELTGNVRPLSSMGDRSATLDAMLDTYAGALKGTGARKVPNQTSANALLRCATIGSLMPLISAARIADVPVPQTEAIVNLVSSVLGADIGSAGRRLEAIGVEAHNIDDARRIMDAIARGNR